jgi:FKBP-type peptidyl-prolyl cis-trans isomerase (trigger factor)
MNEEVTSDSQVLEDQSIENAPSKEEEALRKLQQEELKSLNESPVRYRFSHIEDDPLVGSIHFFELQLEAGPVFSLFNERLAQQSAQSKIKGFRPGKAPKTLIMKTQGQQLLSESLADYKDFYFRKIIEVEDTICLEYRQIHNDIIKNDEGEISHFIVQFQVILPPKLKRVDYVGLELREPLLPDQNEVLKTVLHQLRFKKIEPESASGEDVIKADDIVKINFSFKDKVELSEGDESGWSAPDIAQFPVGLISSSNFPQSLHDSLIGKKIGESFEVSDEKSNKRYRGEILSFDKVTLPEWSDELACNFGTDDQLPRDATSYEDLKNMLHEEIVKQQERERKEALHKESLDILEKKYPFEIPRWLKRNAIVDMFKGRRDPWISKIVNNNGPTELGYNLFGEQAARLNREYMFFANIARNESFPKEEFSEEEGETLRERALAFIVANATIISAS